MKTLIALLALFLLCLTSVAEAACTGSGLSWACPAGATSSDVQAAINSAADGATITFAPGSYPSWTTYAEFNPARGATLICATVGGCNITANNIIFGVINGVWTSPVNKLFRISGFNFTGSSGNGAIWFRCGDNIACGFNTFGQIRIDHNTFTDTGTVNDNEILFGQASTKSGLWTGVIDHNTFTNPTVTQGFIVEFSGFTDPNPPATPLGTVNNMFIEDNTFFGGSIGDSTASDYCVDAWGGISFVYRNNTSTNCVIGNHANNYRGGIQNYEVYNNTITVNSNATGLLSNCERCFHDQGAGLLHAFNNVFSEPNGAHGSPLTILDYRDSAYLAGVDSTNVCDGTETGQNLNFGVPMIDGNRTPVASYQGYPCWHAPFRTFGEIAGTPNGGYLYPGYAWNNKWSDDGTQVILDYEDLGGASDYTTIHAVQNRDYFNAVSTTAQASPTSPFNGTTGMGFGTLANRPTTCSRALTDASDASYGGVGYFATDVGPMGTLYHCGTTNTWTVEYVPYTYPHPLVNASSCY